MIDRETADTIWGAEAVSKALAEPRPAPITADLTHEIQQHADPPGAFRAWALAQPWPRFCAIVRIVTSDASSSLLEEDEG